MKIRETSLIIELSREELHNAIVNHLSDLPSPDRKATRALLVEAADPRMRLEYVDWHGGENCYVTFKYYDYSEEPDDND